MNILLLNYEYPPIGGGASNACYCLAHELAAQGHKPVVLTAMFGNQRCLDDEDGVIIYRCKAWRRHPNQSNILEMGTYVLSAMTYVTKIIKQHRIQGVVVFFSMPCGPLGLYAKYRTDVPYVISLRGGDVPGAESSINSLHTLLAPIRRQVLKQSVAVVANSSGLKALSEQVDPVPVQTIPNGVDTRFFCAAEKREPEQPFRFLFVGRFQNQKNIRYLLENMGAARQSCSIPFVLTLVGDGPLKSELKEYAEQLGLSDIVEWKNWCDKPALRDIYQQSDCFVNPSLYEGMPNTVLEAMACGLPVIASNVLGNDELVKHGETGYLFVLDKPDDFQRVLIDLLKNREKSMAFGLAGRHRVDREYSWRRVVQEYLALF